jgi:hypothetical protein
MRFRRRRSFGRVRAKLDALRGRSSVGRASASQAEGRGFDPRRPLWLDRAEPARLGGFSVSLASLDVHRWKRQRPLDPGRLARNWRSLSPVVTVVGRWQHRAPFSLARLLPPCWRCPSSATGNSAGLSARQRTCLMAITYASPGSSCSSSSSRSRSACRRSSSQASPSGSSPNPRPPIGANRVLSVMGNVIWFVLAGIWIAIGHVISAVLCAITSGFRSQSRT